MCGFAAKYIYAYFEQAVSTVFVLVASFLHKTTILHVFPNRSCLQGFWKSLLGAINILADTVQAHTVQARHLERTLMDMWLSECI